MGDLSLFPVGKNLSLMILFAGLVYTATLALYRLYLHPLRSFPGPRLAAFTFWYEFYYDVVLGGQYTFQIRRLHKRYGPIIRINPHELHVYTPDFYDELYAGGNRRRDKWYWATKAFGGDTSTVATTKHELHRARRAALNPFFSKRQVRRLQPLIEERFTAFLGRLKEFQKSDEVFPLDKALSAYSADVIMEYCFGKSADKLNAPDFDITFHQAVVNGAKNNFLMRQFPWILWTMKRMPTWLLLWMNPDLSSFIQMHRDIGRQVRKAMNAEKQPSPSEGICHSTVYQEILNSGLPPQEKGYKRLAEDSGAAVTAGTVTTAWTITVTIYHLLSNPNMLRKLKDELSSTDSTDLSVLENLPYLAASIQEGLRLSYGASTRLARIAPDEVLVFTDPDTQKAWTIPPNTPVSMTGMLVFQDSTIFPDPSRFDPERWITNPRLSRYQVAFSKGSRICVGMNLAYAEITLMLAELFRHFGSPEVHGDRDIGTLELFETTVDNDVECWVDAIAPLPKEESKGVRVRVLPVAE